MLMCVPFLVSCVLGLVILSEEGSSLLTNGSVLFWIFFLSQWQKFLYMLLTKLLMYCRPTLACRWQKFIALDWYPWRKTEACRRRKVNKLQHYSVPHKIHEYCAFPAPSNPVKQRMYIIFKGNNLRHPSSFCFGFTNCVHCYNA
jgi:hypothetical protein